MFSTPGHAYWDYILPHYIPVPETAAESGNSERNEATFGISANTRPWAKVERLSPCFRPSLSHQCTRTSQCIVYSAISIALAKGAMKTGVILRTFLSSVGDWLSTLIAFEHKLLLEVY